MEKWERIIRNNFKHLDKVSLDAVVAIFAMGIEERSVYSLDKDYILEYCDKFCKYAGLPKSENIEKN